MNDLPLPARLDIDQIVEHSFKDMHVRGFDYLCLHRSPEETIKLYFFDGDMAKKPEVVAPHDHRYDFETYVAAGAVENVWFRRSHNDELGEVFNWFEYRTPGASRLMRSRSSAGLIPKAGDSLCMPPRKP